MGGDRTSIGAAEAASMLGWWIDAGVDVAIQETARNWLQAEAPPPPSSAPRPAAAEQAIPETLDLFRDWLVGEQQASFAAAAAGRVLPRGAADAPVMLLADAPSSEDAAAGQPIGGKAWALMERMLAAIGIAADEAYAANISCFHAPGQRLDAAQLEACASIARRHIALARPKRLLLLGDGPAKALLGKPLVTARGHVHRVEGVRTVATFHPRELLERAPRKELAWRDLLLLTEE